MRVAAARAVRRAGLYVLAAVLAQGCASQEGIRCAITDINKEFQEQYERILAEKGARRFTVPPADAFVGTRAALFRLGMRLETQDPDLGLLSVAAPAPTPLTQEEWKLVAQADLPMMQQLAARCVGLPAYLLKFEPEGLEIVITATILPAQGGSEISLTARMRQVTPPPSGMPRREYAPPTGVHKALDKLWEQIERELGVKGRPI
jgi:hypothetical protein